MKQLTIIALFISYSWLSNAQEINVSYTGYFALIEACYFEGRNQTTMGKKAIIQTVLNRRNSKRYPNSIHGVVYQSKQFSFTEITERAIRDTKSYKDCQDVVNQTLTSKNKIHGHTHYWACEGDWAISTPNWAKGLQSTKFGDHCYVSAK